MTGYISTSYHTKTRLAHLLPTTLPDSEILLRKRLRLTCRLIDEEVLAVYCSNNSLMLQIRCNDNVHYPQKAYV